MHFAYATLNKYLDGVHMGFLGAVFEILMCLFAVLGVYFTVTRILDCVTIKNAPAKCMIVVETCKKEDFEYLVRFLECRFADGDYGKIVESIGVLKDLDVSEEVLSKLSREFGNIYLI